MAKTRLNLNDDWQVESVVLANLLPNDARVLFIYNEDYERIKKICEKKNITATIMNDDMVALEKASIDGDISDFAQFIFSLIKKSY